MYPVIVILAIIHQGASLQCYQCKLSKDGQACLEQQEVVDCGLSYSNPSCMSNTYDTVLDGNLTTLFGKKCLDYEFCNEYCDKPMMADALNCQKACCRTDYCNEQVFNKVGVYEQKSKRSNNLQDSANHQPIFSANRLLVLLNIVLIMIVKFTLFK